MSIDVQENPNCVHYMIYKKGNFIIYYRNVNRMHWNNNPWKPKNQRVGVKNGKENNPETIKF